MRKLVLFMHLSIDGFAAGPNREMDWIHVDGEMFEYAGQRTRVANTVIYGRRTYEIMDAYWPTAADNPKASPHDIEHGTWYNQVQKIVISKSLKGKHLANGSIISENINKEVRNLKEQEGEEIVMFGSPTTAQIMMNDNLIDDYWFFINPIILGGGISMFADIKDRIKLKLVETIPFASGVICLHYEKI